MDNNGRLRRMLTQFLNRQNRNRDTGEAFQYLERQMSLVEEQLKSVNDSILETSNEYYQALSEGNVERAQQLDNQIRDMKERKKRYKNQKKQIKENIEEIKDLQDVVEDQGEQTRNAFGDAFDDLTNVIQTLNIKDIKDKIGDSVDSVNDAIREASNSLGLSSDEKKALTSAIYDNTNAINKAAGKNILSVNDAADDIASLIEAGMTNQSTIGELAPLLAEGNKLLGLDSDEIADLAVKFQDNPDIIKNLYNMMANGKMNLPDEYKDYALKGYEEYAGQSNEMAQVLKNYQDRGLDVNNINAQLLAINSTLQKNSLGEMDISQMIQDANSMNQSEFAEAYGVQAVKYLSSIQQGNMDSLTSYLQEAVNSIQNGTPKEQWQQMYGDTFDYQALKNGNVSLEQIATDYQKYLSTYQQGINNSDVMNQLAQSHSMSPLEEFWNYFSGLPFIQKLSTFMGDMDLGISDLVMVGYGITGILKNFPGLGKLITKPLTWLTGLFGGTSGVGSGGVLASLGTLFSGLGSKLTSLFGSLTSTIGGVFSGSSGILSTLGSVVTKAAPWLSIGNSVIQGGMGIFDGLTSDNQNDKTRGWTKAGMNLGGAGIGAAIGTFLFPGLGTLAGAGIGSAVGSIGDWLFGDKIAGLFGYNKEDIKQAEATADMSETMSVNSEQNQSMLSSIYTLLSEWYDFYKNGARDKAEAMSYYPAFNSGMTTSTADMTSTNTISSQASNVTATPQNISSGAVYDNYMKNTGIEKGSIQDSGSDIAPGFEGSHKDGLDYVPHDDYRALLHKGEAVLTAEDNKRWQSFLAEENVREANFKSSTELLKKLKDKDIISQAQASMQSFEDAIKQASTPTVATMSTSDSSNLTAAVGDDFLGRYGCAFESGGSSTSSVDPGKVSTLAGDSGGTSYGVYQMATNGEAPQFGRWVVENYPNDIGKLFAGKTAGTSGFNNAWTSAYKQYGNQFLAAQAKFFGRPGGDYQNWVSGVKRISGLNLEENRGYQEMACSLAAHNGTGGESRWNKLVGQWYKQGKTGEALIDAVCDARIQQWINGRNTGKYGRKPAENRWGVNSDERKTLKQLLTQSPIAYAQGTPFVPNDQVALIHKGEMIVPKSNNPLANGSSVSSINSNNEDKNTIKELKEIARIIQQGIQFIGKKMETTASQEQPVNINSNLSRLSNLRETFANNQL